jgi:hypothetical protein
MSYQKPINRVSCIIALMTSRIKNIFGAPWSHRSRI